MIYCIALYDSKQFHSMSISEDEEECPRLREELAIFPIHKRCIARHLLILCQAQKELGMTVSLGRSRDAPVGNTFISEEESIIGNLTLAR